MKILLAVEGSEPSERAVEAVASRPWPADTIVRVLSAVQTVVPPAATLWGDAGGNVVDLEAELRQHAEEVAGRAARLLEAAGLGAETVTRHGDPRSVIVDEAGEWDADLIVVGSHGYTGLRRFFLGSVAQSVVSHAPCSVEVIRSKLPKAAEAAPPDEENSAATPIPLPPA